MAEMTMLNIRMPAELKARGMQVLEREGVSVSEIVRGLFAEMERSQRVPDFAKRTDADRAVERKRTLLRSMSGILPERVDLREVRADRLEEKCKPGVRP